MPSDITAHEKNNTIVSDASEARIEALQNLSNLLETWRKTYPIPWRIIRIKHI